MFDIKNIDASRQLSQLQKAPTTFLNMLVHNAVHKQNKLKI